MLNLSSPGPPQRPPSDQSARLRVAQQGGWQRDLRNQRRLSQRFSQKFVLRLRDTCCSDGSEDRNLISYVISYVSEAASLPLRQSRLVTPPATTCIWFYLFFFPLPCILFECTHLNKCGADYQRCVCPWRSWWCCIYLYILLETSSSQSVEWTPFCCSRNLPHMSSKSMPGVRYRLAVLLFAVLHWPKSAPALEWLFSQPSEPLPNPTVQSLVLGHLKSLCRA